MRNLLIFLLILFAIWWIRRALRRRDEGDAGARQERRGHSDAESMRACAQCGVHVPESEGVRDGDRFFCCEEHRRLGVRR